MISFKRFNDERHWLIEIPLSLRRRQAYSSASDQMEPLHKYWAFTWKRETICGNFTEIRIRFGVCYK